MANGRSSLPLRFAGAPLPPAVPLVLARRFQSLPPCDELIPLELVLRLPLRLFRFEVETSVHASGGAGLLGPLPPPPAALLLRGLLPLPKFGASAKQEIGTRR